MNLPDNLKEYLASKGFANVCNGSDGSVFWGKHGDVIDIRLDYTESTHVYVKKDEAWQTLYFNTLDELATGIMEHFKDSFVEPAFYNME